MKLRLQNEIETPGSDVSNCLRVLLAMLNGDTTQVICHRSTKDWVYRIYNHSNITLTTFSKQCLPIESIISGPGQNVVFFDFDIYVRSEGIRSVLQIFKKVKIHKRVFVVSSQLDTSLPQIEKIANYCISLNATGDDNVFESKSAALDRKGILTEQTHTISIRSSGKPFIAACRKNDDEKEIINKDSVDDQKIELPFFTSRNENGVAIRDATTKKIRIGGQVVYEPDRDDDLDDSDPDDDLNI